MALVYPYKRFPHRHRDTFIRQRRTTQDRRKDEEETLGGVYQCSGSRLTGDAAILRLPVEVMAEIFQCSQLLTFDKSALAYINGSWCWITITHICKYWRYVALTTQALWSHIDIRKLAHAEQTSVFLERSGSSPLHVIYECAGMKDSARESLRLTLQHMRRIRYLSINETQSGGLFKLIQHPAPVLEYFSLKTISNIDVTPFLAGQAPNLTSLELYTRPFKWESVSTIQKLRHLAICTPLNIEQLLSFISQSVAYKELSISTLQTSTRHIQIQPQITLPLLKKLSISNASYKTLLELFNNVEFPAADSWKVVCKDYPFKVGEVADPKGAIPRTTSSWPLSLGLDISFEVVRFVATSLYDATDELPPRRSVSYSWYSPVGILGEAITIGDVFGFVVSVIKGDFWCSARELTIKVDSMGAAEDLQTMGVGIESWKSLLELLPQLRKLTVKHVWGIDSPTYAFKEPHHGLLSALGSPPEKNDSGDVICPMLSELHLYGFNLDATSSAVRMLELLKERKNWGRQISLIWVRKIGRSQSPHGIWHLLERSEAARIIKVDM